MVLLEFLFLNLLDNFRQILKSRYVRLILSTHTQNDAAGQRAGEDGKRTQPVRALATQVHRRPVSVNMEGEN